MIFPRQNFFRFKIRRYFSTKTTTFQDLGLNKELSNALKSQNITSPTAIQKSTIKAALQGKDVLCTAQTGTGKT